MSVRVPRPRRRNESYIQKSVYKLCPLGFQNWKKNKKWNHNSCSHIFSVFSVSAYPSLKGEINQTRNILFYEFCPLGVQNWTENNIRLKIELTKTKQQLMYIFFCFVSVRVPRPRRRNSSNMENVIYELLCPLGFNIERKQ